MHEWHPTHRLQLGTGKKRTYWLVMAVGPLGCGKEDGLLYYHCVTGPRNRSGVHFVTMVPETRLKPLRTK
jgi:hypothetical protein